jgi:dTDP-4-dehydrorhamnose reductase
VGATESRAGRPGGRAVSRWLITGAEGMLGHDLLARLRRDGAQATGLDRGELDITDVAAVRAAAGQLRPDIVVNCAAWTAVDAAEAHEDAALAVNGGGPAALAAACASGGARLVQLSTDYVFDGTAQRPYPEDGIPAPRSAYGRTKLAGEQAVLSQLPDRGYVVRTAWLYGAHGPNFVRTMIRLERQRPELDVADDQHGQPTWTVDVAHQIIALIEAGAPPGIYHATSSGETTWCGLAREVFRQLGADPARVRATDSSALQRPAPRPAYSVLRHHGWARAGVAPIRDWQLALSQALPALVAAETEHTGEPADRARPAPPLTAGAAAAGQPAASPG